jgi:hypothetical protein
VKKQIAALLFRHDRNVGSYKTYESVFAARLRLVGVNSANRRRADGEGGGDRRRRSGRLE